MNLEEFENEHNIILADKDKQYMLANLHTLVLYKDGTYTLIKGDKINESCFAFKYRGEHSTKGLKTLDLTKHKLTQSHELGNVYKENNYTISIVPKLTWFPDMVDPSTTTPLGVVTKPLYCSSNYTLLTAISMSQQSNDNQYEQKMWFDSSLLCQYYLNKYESDIISNIQFAKTETLGYAKANWNFIPNLFYSDSITSKLTSYDDMISLNQGLGCGNAISSTEHMALMFMNVISGRITASSFINKYILFQGSEVPPEISNNIILGYPYSAGVMNFDQDLSSQYIKPSSPCVGHIGESYGVSTYLLGNGGDYIPYKISIAIAINIEDSVDIVKNIAYPVYQALLDAKDPTSDITNAAVSNILTRVLDSINVDNWTPSGVCVSLTYVVLSQIYTQRTETLCYYYNNDQWVSITTPFYKFNWGSCGSKLMTALNTIIMVYEQNDQPSADKLWDLLSKLTAYELLSKNVMDYRLEYKTDPSYNSTTKKSIPNARSNSKLSFVDSYNVTFLDPDSSSNPINLTGAKNYNSLSLKRLLYMNSNLQDFDSYSYLTTDSCQGGDLVFSLLQDSNNTGNSYPYGPFQWCQMATRCIPAKTPPPDSDLTKKLNQLYQNDTGKTLIDPSSGIFLSIFNVNQSNNGSIRPPTFLWNNARLSCNVEQGDVNVSQHTVLCPPFVPRFSFNPNQIGKVLSFSYIRSDFTKIIYDKYSLGNLVGQDYGKHFIIYDNTISNSMLSNNIFCSFNGDGDTFDNAIDPSLGIACGKSSTFIQPTYKNTDSSFILNYKTSLRDPNSQLRHGGYRWYNEVVIKSWNYNSNGASGNGNNDSSGVLQNYGWRDVASLSEETKQPILALGIITQNKKLTESDLINLNQLNQICPPTVSKLIVGMSVGRKDWNNPFFSVPIISKCCGGTYGGQNMKCTSDNNCYYLPPRDKCLACDFTPPTPALSN